jgi:hypothetical protein
MLSLLLGPDCSARSRALRSNKVHREIRPLFGLEGHGKLIFCCLTLSIHQSPATCAYTAYYLYAENSNFSQTPLQKSLWTRLSPFIFGSCLVGI